MRVRATALALIMLCVAACATTQSKFRPLGATTYPPEARELRGTGLRRHPARPALRTHRPPGRPLREDVLRDTFHDTAIEELKKQARAAGADAIIEIDERRSRLNETLILHVTATAIHFTGTP